MFYFFKNNFLSIYQYLYNLYLFRESQSSFNDRKSKSLNIDGLIENAPNIHPKFLFKISSYYFKRGDKRNAIFWYYIAVIRIHSITGYLNDKFGDVYNVNSLYFEELNSIGKPIIEYASNELEFWSSEILNSIYWDNTHKYLFLPESRNCYHHLLCINELTDLSSQIISEKEFISIRKSNI